MQTNVFGGVVRGMGSVVVATFILAWTGAAWVVAETPRFNDDRLQRIRPRMQQFVDEGKIAGAVTLIATKDKVVHLQAIGRADIAADRPMDTDSIFRIASMTKPITATALMMLVEQGKLEVDAPVAKYIPAFAGQKLKSGEAARPVTIRDILTHTAGLSQPDRNGPESQTLAEIVDGIGRRPLEFPAGTKWQYSSGLTVAGRLVEIASGESFADYLKRHIFEPLGMKDTTFQLTANQAKRLATTYRPGADQGSLAPVTIPDPTQARTPNPSGGLYSTAADLAKFYQMIMNGGAGEHRLVKPETVSRMTTILTEGLTTGFTPGNGWGLGWCVLEKPQGVTRLLSPGSFGHGGAWGTQGWIDPTRGLIFVLLIQRSDFGNSDGSDVRDAFTELAVQAHNGVETNDARFIEFAGYQHAIELKRGEHRAVLCPEAGGRVLEFATAGFNAMYLDPNERSTPTPSVTAGRFDFGPELTTPQHPVIWSGEWTAEILGPHTARLTSQRDEASGVQLIREFTLRESLADPTSHWLSCRQTIINTSGSPKEYCHWGRSFSPGGGICFVPLQGVSRFPSKYAMYEEGAIINVKNADDKIRERDGFLEILAPPRKPKLGFDSYAGWLAYLLPDDLLFVKRFASDSNRVYNEAASITLSVWYPTGPRIELEPIGPRERLQPGEAASFEEQWWLLPGKIKFPANGESTDLKRLREVVESSTK